jgi:hypothetical protein
MAQKISLDLTKIDWPWVGVGFCFYVVFHLLPTYLLAGMGATKYGNTSFGVWLFAGLAFIGLYIGYRSRGVTIIEPGIAALAYVVVLFLSGQQSWGITFGFSQFLEALGSMIAAFVVAIGSAFVGELLQQRKEKAEH